jgi:hypothetical protein
MTSSCVATLLGSTLPRCRAAGVAESTAVGGWGGREQRDHGAAPALGTADPQA